KMKFQSRNLDPFMVGLLHDLGIAIEHQFLFNDGFHLALSQRFEKQSLLADEERICMGVTHEEIGELVARKWNFPSHLVAVIGHHHRMESDHHEFADLLHVVRLAEYLSFKQQHGYCDFSEPYALTLKPSQEALGISDDALLLVSDQLAREMANLVNLGWFSELRIKLR
ncbi:MAG: HDOD domain-containing protein, partial [Lentisphaerota bacterium]